MRQRGRAACSRQGPESGGACCAGLCVLSLCDVLTSAGCVVRMVQVCACACSPAARDVGVVCMCLVCARVGRVQVWCGQGPAPHRARIIRSPWHAARC